MKLIKFPIKLFLILFGLANAEKINITPTWSVDSSQIKAFTDSLSRLDKATNYFHWGAFTDGLRWIDRSFIDKGEMEFWTKPSSANHYEGDGVYMSADPRDSSEFGPFPVVFVQPTGTLIYDLDRGDNKYLTLLNKTSISLLEQGALGKIVPFLVRYRNFRKGIWYVTYNANVTTKIVSPTSLPKGSLGSDITPVWPTLEYSKDSNALWKIMGGLRGMDKSMSSSYLRDTFGWFDSFISLIFYSDAISVYRAIKVNPSDPWKEFEPQDFGKFKNAKDTIVSEQLSGKDIGIVTTGGYWGSNDKLKSFMMRLQSLLSGVDPNLRNEGFKSGGDEVNGTILVTPKELGILTSNRYLTVESKPSNGNHYISFLVPDVFHYQNLTNILNPAIVQKIQQVGEATLRTDSNLRQQLNIQIVTSLLDELINRVANKPFLNTPLSSRQFISIRPYKQFNRRVFKIFIQAAFASILSPFQPHDYISDLDLLLNDGDFDKFSKASSQCVTNLILSVFKTFVLAIMEKKSPNYYELPEWDSLHYQSFGALGNLKQKNFKFDGEDFEFIRKRQFTRLLQKYIEF